MTVTIAALVLIALTVALWAEDRSFRRKHPTIPPLRARCMCCPGAPLVDDAVTHSRLAHAPRVVGVEDRAEWSA